VIYSTVQFVTDMVWYPEIVGALSPHILAGLFFDCLLDGQVIPGKMEHTSSIGMALASVLSTWLTIEPENQVLRELCQHIHNWRPGIYKPTPMFDLVVVTLKYITCPVPPHPFVASPFRWIYKNSSTLQKLLLSRIVLQTVWRLRCAMTPIGVSMLDEMESFCETLTTENDENHTILKTNIFLIMAITLGLQIDIHDLYAPNNQCVISLFPHRVYS